MRVAYVASFGGDSGATTHALALLEEFAGLDDLDVWGVQCVETGWPEPFVSEDAYPYPVVFPNTIREGLELVDPDIVYVHVFNMEMLSAMREMKGSLDAKWIYRFGSNLFEHWVSRATGAEPGFLTYMVEEFDWFDALFCPSHAVIEQLQLYYGSDVPRLAYVSNGVPIERYSPTPLMDDGHLNVLTASRIAVSSFIPAPVVAMRRLSAEIPCSMRILGDSLPPLEDSLRLLISDMDAVDIGGFRNRDAVRRHMERADVVCIPSVSHTAVPMVAIEAMAAGCVVLTADYVVADEEPAMVQVPLDHAPAWYEMLNQVYDDPEAARETVRDGLEAAKAHDVRTVAPTYVDLFRELLDGG